MSDVIVSATKEIVVCPALERVNELDKGKYQQLALANPQFGTSFCIHRYRLQKDVPNCGLASANC